MIWIMDKLDKIIDSLIRIERMSFDARSPWFTVASAATYIKLSERTLRRWIASGILKTYRLPAGGHRVLRKDLDGIVMYGKQYNKLISQQKRMVNELTKD